VRETPRGAPVRLGLLVQRKGSRPDRGGESASGSTSDPSRHNAYPGLPATPGQGNSHVSRETIPKSQIYRAGHSRIRLTHSPERPWVVVVLTDPSPTWTDELNWRPPESRNSTQPVRGPKRERSGEGSGLPCRTGRNLPRQASPSQKADGRSFRRGATSTVLMVRFDRVFSRREFPTRSDDPSVARPLSGPRSRRLPFATCPCGHVTLERSSVLPGFSPGRSRDLRRIPSVPGALRPKHQKLKNRGSFCRHPN
jgi:hypothetical protein